MGGLAALVDEIDGIADRANRLRILVLDLGAELLLQRHDHLDQIERIGIEIADEFGIHRDRVFIHAQPLGDDPLNSFERRCHSFLLLCFPWPSPG